MAKPLAAYHYAWLRTHPDRDEAWLRQVLLDGFHIHHIDGNHSNNIPENLVLVEGTDHMRLHGCAVRRGITAWRAKQKTDRALGKSAYEHRRQGKSWDDVGKAVGAKASIAMNAARRYAGPQGLPWPVKAAGGPGARGAVMPEPTSREQRKAIRDAIYAGVDD